MPAVNLKPFRFFWVRFCLVATCLSVSLTARAGVLGLETSDQEFAQSPLIVVAHWNPPVPAPSRGRKGRTESHSYGGSGTTQIVVDRVIKGDLQPGTYTLETHAQWNDKGNICLDWGDAGGFQLPTPSAHQISGSSLRTPNGIRPTRRYVCGWIVRLIHSLSVLNPIFVCLCRRMLRRASSLYCIHGTPMW